MVALFLAWRPDELPLAERETEAVTAPFAVSRQVPTYPVDLSAAEPQVISLLQNTNEAGVVTDLFVAEGDTISDGDALYSVDGVTRIAVASSRPLYRDLARNDAGWDVEELQRFLMRAGFEVPVVTGRVDLPTVEAIRGLSLLLGERRQDSVFRLRWTRWLPIEELEVGSVKFAIGASAPAPGTALVESIPSYPAIFVSAVDVDRDLSGYTVTIDGTAVGTVDADRLVPAAGASVRERLEPVLSAATGDDGTEADPTILAVGPTESVVHSVAASAVVETNERERCVYLATGDEFASIKVEVVGGGVGRVDLAPTLPPGAQVLLNPLDLISTFDCSGS